MKKNKNSKSKINSVVNKHNLMLALPAVGILSLVGIILALGLYYLNPAFVADKLTHLSRLECNRYELTLPEQDPKLQTINGSGYYVFTVSKKLQQTGCFDDARWVTSFIYSSKYAPSYQKDNHKGEATAVYVDQATGNILAPLNLEQSVKNALQK